MVCSVSGRLLKCLPRSLTCTLCPASVVRSAEGTSKLSFIEAVNAELGATPLHLAGAFNPQPAIIALLLDWGADIEGRTAHGRTPLLTSLGMNANPAAPALLLERGADATAPSPQGGLPIHAAAFNREPAMSVLMLERGGDVMARGPNGRTPRHTSARHNPNLAVVEILLADGADIQAVTDAGVTACGIARATNRDDATLRPLCRQPRASAGFPGQ